MTLDVLLICALKDEYDQVLNVTYGLIDPGWVESHGPKGWTVADASFMTSSGAPLRIRSTWATHMGREQAQAVASMLIQAQPARCLAMCGICAGRRGKVALGDVIFADRLWSYDAGKTTVEDGEERFEGDMFQFHAPPVWIQRMQQVSVSEQALWLAERPALPLENQEDWVLLRLLAGEDPLGRADFKEACPDWSDVLPRLWQRKWVAQPLILTDIGRARAAELQLLHPHGLPSPPAIQVCVAPIATGASVTEDAGIFPRLASYMRKVLGVEMEASALGALGNLLDVPVVVAKAVSDYGDAFKDDRYRRFAARASAECLIGMLRRATDLLPDRDARVTIPPEKPGVMPADPASRTSPSTSTALPRDLIHVLAEEYPDVRDARALWERAGGKVSEVENIPRPRDLWQRLWIRSMQGASVRPATLLKAALEDLPDNTVLIHHLESLTAAKTTKP
ncbi:effector-associated domain EAD1-containing protein [Polyangium sp. 6x1]|uniref:effector-associated domain EAD1-containing protein n=1 Tax=Polyangium sp. 6x1 TaxID=3042689 RepID=UPI0024823E13|nr:effector-associated domain EAD1-containing protein [Polyangium sp. 6x1]MDI1444867.1 effector-associated domain EAD1-containing protein [Polyangium sp. 6x1]